MRKLVKSSGNGIIHAPIIARSGPVMMSTASIAALVRPGPEGAVDADSRPMSEEKIRTTLQDIVKEIRVWAPPRKQTDVLHPTVGKALIKSLS